MIDRDINNLSEPFKTKFKAFLSDCKAAGMDVRIGEGKREPLTQLLYFLQGRLGSFVGENKALVDEYHELRKRVGLFPVSTGDSLGKKITWTLKSNHFDGNAADVLVFSNGIVNWWPDEAVWEKIAQLAEKNGLSSGHRWPAPKKDSPHIELKGI
jgi:hypothetical protein